MFTSQMSPGVQGPQSNSTIPPDDGIWRPSLRKMTKRMFSNKAPARPSRPELPQQWMEGNTFEHPSPNDLPHTTLSEHPRGLRQPSEENLSFIKRTFSKRDKEHTHRRTQTHGSKPSTGARSCTLSSSSADFASQVARDNRYPETDAETSPSSTIARDLPTPNRTSYTSKRCAQDFTSNTILLPTVYQPPTEDQLDVDIDSFPTPPFDPYHTNPDLNPRIGSPILFQFPSHSIVIATHTKPDGKEKLHGVQGGSIPERQETSSSASPTIARAENQKAMLAIKQPVPQPIGEIRDERKTKDQTEHPTHEDGEEVPIIVLHPEAPRPEDGTEENRDLPKSTEQLNDDFQLFLAKSRTQAQSRNTNLKSHNFKPEPKDSPRNFTGTTDRIKNTPPQPRSQPQYRLRPFSTNVTPPQLDIQSTNKSQPDISPEPNSHSPSQNLILPSTPNAITPSSPHFPLQSRFSIESRNINGSASSSLYGKIVDFMFPSRSRPTSTHGHPDVIPPGPNDTPRLYVDKNKRSGYGTTSNTGRSGRWSRMGRTIKRSMLLERKEAEVGETLNDREELRELEGGTMKGSKRGIRIMPTSRGLDRYNRTVNGGYWK